MPHKEQGGKRPPKFGKLVPGVFSPVLAKHSKSFSLIDRISLGVDRMQRNFEPMRKQVRPAKRASSRMSPQSLVGVFQFLLQLNCHP